MLLNTWRNAGGAHRCDHAAGTGQWHHWQLSQAHRLHQSGARVADGRGACITHIGHACALLQALNHHLRTLCLVVLVHCQQLCGSFVNAIGPQQRLGVAGVFTGHHIGQLQHMQRAQADVCQVANRCGHHKQRARPIILVACRLQGCTQRQGVTGAYRQHRV